MRLGNTREGEVRLGKEETDQLNQNKTKTDRSLAVR